MLRRYLPTIAIFLLLFILASFPLLHSLIQPVLSVTNHIVISEVQISGDGEHAADDEFVELYNPTDSNVVMSGWKLTRKNSSGTQANLVSTLNGTIPTHGYFLIVDGAGYNGNVTADVSYSASSNALTNNYTVLLYDDTSTIVDKVGFGSANDPENTSFASNPAANSSIERKTNSSSTESSMSGGSDQFLGNEEDTDNNANDYVTRTVSDPQNSSSTIEPVLTSPSPSPTVVPTPSPTPSPTPEVSPSPSPTVEPSPSPSASPSSSPTSSPIVTPSPSISPSPTPQPSTRPSASPRNRNYSLSCNVSYHTINFHWFSINIPYTRCTVIRD